MIDVPRPANTWPMPRCPSPGSALPPTRGASSRVEIGESMRYLIRISAAAVAACMASLVALSSAPAAVTPLPKIQAHNVVGWSGWSSGRATSWSA